MAAGMLAPSSEASAPGPFLDLAQESLGRWPEFAARLEEESGQDCELSLCGVLGLVLDPGEVAPARERLVWQSAAGVRAEWLDAASVGDLEPAAASCAGAAWYPDEGHVHPARVIEALLLAGRRYSLEVRSGAEVVGWAGPGCGLQLSDDTEVGAAAVVLCAGAWTPKLAAALGCPELPVVPVRGQLIGLRRVPLAPRHVLYAGRRGYALTRRGGTVLVGATEEEAGFDASVTAAASERLLETGRRLLRDAAAAGLAGAWAGLRPRAPDELPVLGEVETDPARRCRVLVATGHHRNGVLLAPATATGMAEAALDGQVPADWDAFSPGRFH